MPKMSATSWAIALIAILSLSFVMSLSHDEFALKAMPEAFLATKKPAFVSCTPSRPASPTLGGREVKDQQLPEALPSTSGAGDIQPVAASTHPDAASVMEALASGRHPERLTTQMTPRAFSRTEFERDPGAYVHTVEPGRVFLTAQPAKGVPTARAACSTRLQVDQGSKVALKVVAAPRSPVTFTSFDVGAFDNGLTSITVLSDEYGAALAWFHGTDGTIGDCRILAGCPEAQGRVDFVVEVLGRNSEVFGGKS